MSFSPRLAVGLLPALLLLAGCPSVSTMSTARVLDPGKFQMVAAPGIQGFTVEVDNTDVDDNSGPGMMPGVELGARYGMAERMDLGFKFGMFGVGADVKIQLLRSETEQSGLDLAIDPGLGYGIMGSVMINLPLLIGINFAGHQLVLGPKLVHQTWLAGSSGEAVTFLYAGGSVGLALRLGDTFRLLPEVSYGYPVSRGKLENGSAKDLGFGFPTFQVGLGLMFGG